VLKILHIVSSTNPAGGGPIEGIKRNAEVILTKGHLVEIVTTDTHGDPWLENLSVKVYPMGPASGNYRYSPNLIGWLAKNYQNYDACIVNGLWQFHGYAAWKVLHSTSTPYYVFPHGMLDPWFKHHYPLKHIKKSLYWGLTEHKVLRDANSVFFTTEDERLLARGSFKPYNIKEQVVGYGTTKPIGDREIQRAAFFEACPAVKGKRTILFLSRIHEKKGCDLLIRAFASVQERDHNLHLVMAGPDDNGICKNLKRLAATLGIADNVTWPGMLTGASKWGAFRVADVFALPSHQENFGVAVAEAMACGCPVLISNKVNIWREINADKAGLVANDDLAGTRDLLNRWLDTPDADKKKMGKNAQLSFDRRFELSNVANCFITVIAEGGELANHH
jgi:glycosyltransferase involved in cell wall biosynthesis